MHGSSVFSWCESRERGPWCFTRIVHLLAAHEGNRSECARILDIGRNTLIRKIKECELD